MVPTPRPVAIAVVLISALTGCKTFKPPEISYDVDPPPLASPTLEAPEDPRSRPLLTPPGWTPAHGGKVGTPDADDALARVEAANTAARVEPRKDGYYNSVQVYPYSPGALYQVYAKPGQITDIALEPGEQLIGSGPIAAGDTTRWIIGDTESGGGEGTRVHILVKPTRPDIDTNLVVNTDRRTYVIELRSREKAYMPSVAWAYPESRKSLIRMASTPVLPDPAHMRFRYRIEGDGPPWRPLRAYDDGRKTYIEFPRGISQGEMPPLFVIGADGKPQLVNYRAYRNLYIVDRLFAAAELRLGGKGQQKVRIVRTDGRPAS